MAIVVLRVALLLGLLGMLLFVYGGAGGRWRLRSILGGEGREGFLCTFLHQLASPANDFLAGTSWCASSTESYVGVWWHLSGIFYYLYISILLIFIA